ncbi:MAG TPA: outer membrane lipoprotein LolB [Burkholderiaceae bacterium]|nr:outer membrane lipoprotein LolB [Burkholderiaceae bacterium]
MARLRGNLALVARGAPRIAVPPLAALLLAAVLLAGCQTLAPARGERFYEGRFSITAVAGDKRDSANGRFTLSVRTDGLTLDLASPFGTTIARIESGSDNARLIIPGDADASRSDPAGLDALTVNALGWRLPVAGLADWIDGRGTAGQPVARAADGSDAIVQDGWTIRVVERFDGGAPRQLKMERDADADGAPAMVVRLLLDHAPTFAGADRGAGHLVQGPP